MSKEEKPIAVIIDYPTLVTIYEIIYGIEDYVVATIQCGFEETKKRRYKVYHNSKGSYFNKDNKRYYLSEAIKEDIF